MSNKVQGLVSQHEPINVTQMKELKEGCKPTFIALAILGIIALGLFCTGLASLGAHQNWWSAEGLSQLNQASAVAMVVLGFMPVLGVLSMCISKKVQIKKDQDPRLAFLEQIGERLGSRSYTLCPVIDGNGEYVIVYKNAKVTGFGKVVRNRTDFVEMSRQWRFACYRYKNLYPLPETWM